MAEELSPVRLSALIPPAFRDVHRDICAGGHRVYVLAGGRGSGKSSFASIELWLWLLRHPGANAVVYRKVAATLKRSVYEQLIWAADALGIGACVTARLTPLELELTPTGQRVLFCGADDPGKSKSLKLRRGHFGFLWFEEAAEFAGMGDLRTISASIIRGAGEAVTLLSYNPPAGARAWINREMIVDAPGRLFHRSDYRDMPEGWLGEGFLAAAEALRRSDERAWRQMYLGEVTGTGGQVFENLNVRPITAEERTGAGRIVCGLDFGFAADPDAFIRAGYDRKRRVLMLLDEFSGVRVPSERLCAEVKARAADALVRCDAAEPRMIAALRTAGVRAVAAKKGAGSVREGIRFLQQLSAIVIDPARCPRAAREFSAYEYLRDGEGEFIPDCPDRDNHTIDAVRYALEDEIRAREARTIRREETGIG